MRFILAFVAMAIASAWAQAPAPSPQGAVPDKGACIDCGVVRAIGRAKREMRPGAATESQPGGLVGQSPRGGGKRKAGPSAEGGEDAGSRYEARATTGR